MNTIKDVKLFHEVFNHPIAETPVLIPEKRFKDRLDWSLSEVEEMQDAYDDKDIVEIADALADRMYFLTGDIIEFGLADLFPRIFAEVQRSNMSKACKTLEEAETTVAHYELNGIDSKFEAKELIENNEVVKTIYIIVRTSDGKTLKSINWSEPDLSFVRKAYVDGKL